MPQRYHFSTLRACCVAMGTRTPGPLRVKFLLVRQLPTVRLLYPRIAAEVVALPGFQRLCHVWTAPALQEESDNSAKGSGAAMYSAFGCSRYGRWP